MLGYCRECKFWNPIEGVEDRGVCRKNPPVVFTQGQDPWRQPETDGRVACDSFEFKE